MQRGMPVGNPIANALVVIVGALAIGASIVLGFVAFVIFGGILLVLGAVIGLRVWWISRKLRRELGASPGAEFRQQADVIEGEYTVVQTHRRSDRNA